MVSPQPTHRPVPGSTRDVPPGAQRLAAAAPDAPVQVTLVLRRATPWQIETAPADIAEVQAFADDHGLTLVASHPRARTVTLAGSVAQMNAAFAVDLGDYAAPDGRIYRGREGDVHVPHALAEVVVAVLGLDERTQARAPRRVSPRAGTGYAPQQVAARYGFPVTADGTGQTVAVIELGGGFLTSDLQAYFNGLGLKTPNITAVSVNGANNAPGDPADVEVALDIEVIGAVAQGARQAVYFAPNTSAGFYQGLATAIHDQTRRPSVVSISWGAPESTWTAQALDAYNALFADAVVLGITVVAAAGDNGADDGTTSPTVDFPASSPFVLACGGTTLTATAETVWNETALGEGATGGGVSQHFPVPTYQAGARVPAAPNGFAGRGVPDVAGNADPVTGYQVLVGGRTGVVGGTSAVAPLWAGLIAIANQINGARAGAPHAALYAHPAAFTDITVGDNVGYRAGPGWDPCTGLGTPLGQRVALALAPAAPPPPPPPPPPSGGGAPPPAGADVAVLVTLLKAFAAYTAATQAAAAQLQTAVDQAIAALSAPSTGST